MKRKMEEVGVGDDVSFALEEIWGGAVLVHSTGCRSAGSQSVVSLHQNADHRFGIERLQVGISLARSHEHDRLARDVRHGYGRAHL